MNVTEIQKHVDGLVAAMLAKGLRQPEAQFWVCANREPQVYLRWNNSQSRESDYSHDFRFFDGTAEKALSEATQFIAALPDREERQFKEFMSALGCVIDLGKENGIEVEFLNPLVATMKKLSENAITHQATAYTD